ncbi:conserved hypothetical protein [Anaeromyxobacter dehalogenans 2CP-1]|uniref:Lipoprotein n=1 Tax=Anaeromyxobacter dehalogenans (strain ATCC BAA-258 / DSM 21875 / 2CP-1) TaxID=455488 RepID=B8JA45_ANAD2|nr:hypothetical protein [Anaeromyxobacter dehalogenans]ACL65564.1 conserved hypothetical protein [Anaeromyxobacter dehalogenans 2CP-1]
MNRPLLPAALGALALALAGCPLPQPLPDYPKGGTITPPRILADGITVNGVAAAGVPLVTVPADCAGAEPRYELAAQLLDSNTLEQVEVRWFVDYQPTQGGASWVRQESVPASADQTVLTRDPSPFTFLPYQHAPRTAGAVHVVELVVSNNFFAPADEAALPNRSAASGFETQVYRWTFLLVPGTDGCPAS